MVQYTFTYSKYSPSYVVTDFKLQWRKQEPVVVILACLLSTTWQRMAVPYVLCLSRTVFSTSLNLLVSVWFCWCQGSHQFTEKPPTLRILASDEVRKKKIHFWHKQKPPSKTKAMLATSFATRQFIRKAATHGARSASRAFATQSSLFTPRVVRNAGVNHLSNCVLLVFWQIFQFFFNRH